jgi:Hsp70 protein
MLFQIEEPDGSPLEAEGPGMAIGIDLAGRAALVAVAVGGNAELLAAPDGASDLATATLRDAAGRLRAEPVAAALLALRLRAERALSRPVTHAVLAAPPLGGDDRSALEAAAAASGLTLTRILAKAEAEALAGTASGVSAAALGAAIAAEDDSAALLPRA